MKSTKTMYKRHRFPPEIIQYAVWLYHRFNLSHRDIEDLLSERGIPDIQAACLCVLGKGSGNIER
jgi:transposase-like protein